MEHDNLKTEFNKDKKVLTKNEKVGIFFMAVVCLLLLGYIGYILTKDSIDFKSKLSGVFGNKDMVDTPAQISPVQNLNPNEIAQMNSIKAQQEAEIQKIKANMENEKNNSAINQNSNIISNNQAIEMNTTGVPSIKQNNPVSNIPSVNFNPKNSVINQPIIKLKKCKCISKKKSKKETNKKFESIPKDYIYPLYY